MGEVIIGQDADITIFQNGASRDTILAFQKTLETLPQIYPPLKHYFAPGLYVREIFLEAGAVVVGKIHKHAHFNDISRGRVLVTTEFGSDEFVAPCRFVSRVGTKRCVMALEDTVWTTFHPTHETDIDKILDDITAKNYDDFDSVMI